jgi:hypothetical protein
MVNFCINYYYSIIKTYNINLFLFSNARAKKFSTENLNLILNIPIAPSLYELEKILYTLEQSEEPKIKGIIYLFIHSFFVYINS